MRGGLLKQQILRRMQFREQLSAPSSQQYYSYTCPIQGLRAMYRLGSTCPWGPSQPRTSAPPSARGWCLWTLWTLRDAPPVQVGDNIGIYVWVRSRDLSLLGLWARTVRTTITVRTNGTARVHSVLHNHEIQVTLATLAVASKIFSV